MKKILLIVLLLAVIVAVSARRSKKPGKHGPHGPKKPKACSLTNCKKCHSNQYSCDECNHGFVRVRYPVYPPRYSCWKRCPLGQSKVKGTCERVKKQECSPNCKTCQGRFSGCSVCEPGYSLHKGFTGMGRCLKKCFSGYKKEVNPMGGDKCVRQCTPNCKTCQGRFFCSVCEHGYSLHKGSLTGLGLCLKKCPPRYKTEVDPKTGGNKCARQCQVGDCESCPPDRWSGIYWNTKCARCKPDFYKLSVGSSWQQRDFCFSHCPSGYVPKIVTGVSECQKVLLPEPEATPEPSAEPETTEEPTTEPDSWTTPEPETTTPEEPTEPDSWTTPEPEATTPEEPTTEPDSSTTPEPTTTPEPITEPEPATISTDFWP